MKISREEMKKALEIVKPGLSNNEMIEQATSFAFLKDRVVTYNDEISISHSVGGMNISGAIKAEEFYKFILKTTSNEIEMELLENELQLKAEKSKAGFALEKEIKLPLDEIDEICDKWISLPENFPVALKWAALSCSKNMSDAKLTCVHMDQNGTIQGCSGYRGTQYKTGMKDLTESILVPASSVLELVKYPITKMNVTSKWLHFKTKEGTMFSCRLFNSDYPNTQKAFAEEKGKKIKFPQNINQILEKSEIFMKGEAELDRWVEIEIRKNRIIVKAKGSFAWFKEWQKIELDEKPFIFNVQPALLKDIIEQHKECIVSDIKIMFKAKDWIHVVALVTANSSGE